MTIDLAACADKVESTKHNTLHIGTLGNVSDATPKIKWDNDNNKNNFTLKLKIADSDNKEFIYTSPNPNDETYPEHFLIPV
jgi:hypothetical protein